MMSRAIASGHFVIGMKPFACQPAIAPHLAAGHVVCSILFDDILRFLESLGDDSAMVFVVGAGGWRVPLNGPQTIGHQGLPSAGAFDAGGALPAGRVANALDAGFARPNDGVATRKVRLGAALLGRIPWLVPPDLRPAAARLGPGTLC